MTEAEWLADTEPERMVEFLRGGSHLSERKARLFAVACCRRVWEWMPDEAKQAAEVCEEYADGRVGQKTLAAARRTAYAASKLPASSSGPGRYAAAHSHAGVVALYACDSMKQHEPWQVADWVAATARSLVAHTAGDASDTHERKAHSSWLRDLFGNPFRPVAFDPAWLTAAVLSLAQAAYEERTLPAGTLEHERLAVLADALEDAGCASADLLGHLRSEGPHVRGCRALDLCLGRS
jgi:hypothetical protein